MDSPATEIVALNSAAPAELMPLRRGRGGRQPGAGRPRHLPTPEQRKQAEHYAATGTQHHDIAVILQIDTKTLLKYYRNELNLGAAAINAKVSGVIAKRALDGEYWACNLWAKCRMGWKETAGLELTRKGGGPIAPVGSMVLSTSDAREATRAYLAMICGDDSHDPHVSSRR
jgi:hypothetical protein